MPEEKGPFEAAEDVVPRPLEPFGMSAVRWSWRTPQPWNTPPRILSSSGEEVGSYEAVPWRRLLPQRTSVERRGAECADNVRRWVEDRYMPKVDEYFGKGVFDVGLAPELAELGLFGIRVEGYDCPGMSNVVYGLVCRELERGDSGLRSFVSVRNSLVMYPIHAFGSRKHKERRLPALARGRSVGCFELTEPDIGSDAGHLHTEAVRRGGRLHHQREQNVDHAR